MQHVGQNNDLPGASALLIQEIESQLQPGHVVIIGIINQHAVLNSFFQFEPHRHGAQPIEPLLDLGFVGCAELVQYDQAMNQILDRCGVGEGQYQG